MAHLFPSRSACRFDTNGERRLAERLEKKLDDDYLCWFNIPVGPKALQPDFVILHPQRGVLVLEVKDWKLETILSMTKGTADLNDQGQPKTVKNPLAQARVYALEVVVALQADPELKQKTGSRHAGNLLMPYGWGAVMTRITRKQFEGSGLAEVMDGQRIIFQDEMTESVDEDVFQRRLWNMFHQVFPCNLTTAQIDRVRFHLYPEVRLNIQLGLFGLQVEQAPLPTLINVMDLQQEQLARSLGDGHRVIHGAAGSGKTMILAYRCVHLAQTAEKPVLVLCYNRSLAGRLQQLLDQHGLQDKVIVRNFHAWCRQLLEAFQCPLPGRELGTNAAMSFIVDNTTRCVEEGRIPSGQYAAVLIDEGHDFEPEWFKLVVPMVDPEANSLLVLYDDVQSIYRGKGAKRGLDFSFASVGIQAKGRTTILRMNYRNTLEILSVARTFATELLNAREATDDGVPIITPESAGRRGAMPELLHCASEWHEWHCIAERILDAQGKGRGLNDIGVLYRSKWQAERIEQALIAVQIPYTSALSAKGRSTLYGEKDTVKIVSMHSSKGLEFGLVLIPGLSELPKKGESQLEEARLLYVAMTRAVDQLVMTCRAPSDFSQKIEEAIMRVNLYLQENDFLQATA